MSPSLLGALTKKSSRREGAAPSSESLDSAIYLCLHLRRWAARYLFEHPTARKCAVRPVPNRFSRLWAMASGAPSLDDTGRFTTGAGSGAGFFAGNTCRARRSW